MMPDLGRYALEVTMAYGASLTLLTALALWVWARGRAVRRALDEFENNRRRDG
jgi:heme exporter protein D